MRIGIYAHSVHVRPGLANNVSGHTQFAMKAAECLREAGCDVRLLTTRSHREFTELPVAYPAGVPLDVLEGGQRRRVSRDGGHHVRVRNGSNLLAASKTMTSMARAASSHQLDVIHTVGSPYSAGLAVQATRFGRRGLPAATLHQPVRSAIARKIMSNVGVVFSSNSHTLDSLPPDWTNVYRVRVGLTKKIPAPHAAQTRHRVVFWREATVAAGADLVLAAFDRLAPRHPETSFDLLLRDSQVPEVPGLADIVERHRNVHVHRFPYGADVSLEKSLAEAICVVLPFRKATCNPQLAVLESIMAGAPTVTTRVGSNAELWEAPNPMLLERIPSVDDLCRAVTSCLDKPEAARSAALLHARWAETVWNWTGFAEETLDAYRRHRR